MQYTRLLCWQVKMSSLWLFTRHLVTRLAAKQQNILQLPFESEKVCVWRLGILGSVSMMESTFLCSCRSALKDWAPKKKSINNKHILMVDSSEKKSSCTCWLLIIITLPNQDRLFSINQCHIERIYSLWMHENDGEAQRNICWRKARGHKTWQKTSGVNSQEHLERSWLLSLWKHSWQTALLLILGVRLETGAAGPLSQSQRPKYNDGEGTEEGPPGQTQNVEKYQQGRSREVS